MVEDNWKQTLGYERAKGLISRCRRRPFLHRIPYLIIPGRIRCGICRTGRIHISGGTATMVSRTAQLCKRHVERVMIPWSRHRCDGCDPSSGGLQKAAWIPAAAAPLVTSSAPEDVSAIEQVAMSGRPNPDRPNPWPKPSDRWPVD